MRILKTQGVFDIIKYKEALNKSVRRQRIAQSSAKEYLKSLEQLNEAFNESGKALTSKNLKETLLEKWPRSGWKFLGAIRHYEDQVLKVRNSVLSYTDYNELNQYYYKIEDNLDREPIAEMRSYVRRINTMKEPYRLGFWLQLQSGLRISEIADLEPRDVKFEKQHIYLHVRHGKGNKERNVVVRHDMELYRALKSHIEEEKYISKKGKLFPIPETTMDYQKRNLAKTDRIMRTHDLRRYNARLRFVDAINRGFSKNEALNIVKEQLGHEDIKDTKKYVGKVLDDPTLQTKGGVAIHNGKTRPIIIVPGEYRTKLEKKYGKNLYEVHKK